MERRRNERHQLELQQLRHEIDATMARVIERFRASNTLDAAISDTDFHAAVRSHLRGSPIHSYMSFTEFLRTGQVDSQEMIESYRAFDDWRATRGPLGSNHDQYGENDDQAYQGSDDGGYDERVSHALGSPLASILSHLDAQGTVPSTEQIRGLVDRFHDSDGNQSDGYEYDERVAYGGGYGDDDNHHYDAHPFDGYEYDERAVYDNEPYGDYGDDGHYDDGYQSGDIMSDGYEYDERVEYDD